MSSSKEMDNYRETAQRRRKYRERSYRMLGAVGGFLFGFHLGSPEHRIAPEALVFAGVLAVVSLVILYVNRKRAGSE